jgi:tetratricopeptide (TPR) repeat protein
MAERTETDYRGRSLGNYRIGKKLARGSFGEVYLAEHVLLPRVAAIKFLHAEWGASEQQRQEFLQEAKLLEALKHTHILPLYDAGINQEDFPPYLIAAYAPGGSLRERMRQCMGHFPLEEALTIIEQVGQALQHAHMQPRPVIHRDLKPENILFDSEGRALLADFGIAVTLTANETRQVNVKGTLPYMAPEQFEGYASSKSDQYALGCLAYELITGRRPIQAMGSGWIAWALQHQQTPPPLSQVRADVPRHIELAILKALAKDRDERHPDIEHFLRALRTAPHDPAQYHALKEAWLLEAQDSYAAHHYEQALALYERAADVDPADIRLLKGKGEVLLALNRVQEALAAYTHILRLAPGDAAAVAGIQRIRQQQVQHSPSPPPPSPPPEAQHQAMQRAALVLKAEGEEHLSHGRYTEALAAYEQARRVDPGVALDWCLLGEMYWRLARYAEALMAYDTALRHHIRPDEALIGRGNVLHRLGRSEEALHSYEAAIQYNDQNAAAHYGRALILAEQTRYSTALTAYERALQLQPGFAQASCGKGDVLYQQKAYLPALAAYDQALRDDPTYVNAHYGKADTLMQLKRIQEAQEAYKLALQYDRSEHPSLRQGDALFFLARYSEALAVYEQALQLDPVNPELHERRGNALKKLGQTQEARAAYQHADKLRGYV